MTGAQTGGQRAPLDLDPEEQEERHDPPPRVPLAGGGSGQVERGPQADAENRQRYRQVERQALGRDRRSVDEAARHHPPADYRLERAEPGEQCQPPAEAARDLPPPREPRQRHDQHRHEHARDDAVEPFPEEDALERRQPHAGVDEHALAGSCDTPRTRAPSRRPTAAGRCRRQGPSGRSTAPIRSAA